MPYTGDNLLTAVKRRGMFPDSNGALTDSDILALSDESMLEDIQPALLGAQAGYYVQMTDVTVVAGTSAYRLPKRAVVGRVRDATIVTGTQQYNLEETSEGNEWRYGNSSGDPVAYLMRGDQIVLLPEPAAGVTLRLKYYLRRPRLTQTTSAGAISSINTGTNTVTCTTVPTAFTTALRYDLIRNGGLCDHLDLDKTASAVVTGASGTVTFSSLPADLAVGDYVSVTGEAPIVCLPDEIFPALVGLTLSRCLLAIGDADRGATETKLAIARLSSVIDATSPRSDGQMQKIVNIYSPLRQGRPF